MKTQWYQDTKKIVEALAESGQPFDVSDVRSAGATSPPNSNYWGVLFAASQRLGIVWALGEHRVPGSSNNKPVRRWQGHTRLFASDWTGAHD